MPQPDFPRSGVAENTPASCGASGPSFSNGIRRCETGMGWSEDVLEGEEYYLLHSHCYAFQGVVDVSKVAARH